MYIVCSGKLVQIYYKIALPFTVMYIYIYRGVGGTRSFYIIYISCGHPACQPGQPASRPSPSIYLEKGLPDGVIIIIIIIIILIYF